MKIYRIITHLNNLSGHNSLSVRNDLFFKYFLYPTFRDSNYKHIIFGVVPQLTNALVIFFFSSFSLCVSFLIAFIPATLNSLIFSSVMSNPMLNPPSLFFIS